MCCESIWGDVVELRGFAVLDDGMHGQSVTVTTKALGGVTRGSFAWLVHGFLRGMA